MTRMRFIRPAACLLAALGALSALSRGAAADEDRVWFAPAPGSLDYIRLFQAPSEWPAALRVIDVFKFYQQHTHLRPNAIVGPNTYEALAQAGAFRLLTRTWGKRIALEVGAVKEFYCTTDARGMQDAVQATLDSIAAVTRGGGRVSYLAMDEPFLAGLSPQCGGPSLVPTADRLSIYMKAVRRVYPAIRVGLIEAYPSFTPEQFSEMLQLMQARGILPAFLHADVDLRAMRPGIDDFARDMRLLATSAASRRLAFGIIIWGDNGNADALYAADATNLQEAVKATFGSRHLLPEHIIIQSWAESSLGLRITPNNLPEDRPNTHTELLMRFFLRLFASRSRADGG